LGKDRCAVDL